MSRDRATRRPLQPVGLALKRVQVRHHQTLDAALRGLGLTLVQWDALRNLETHPDASLHDLAQLTFQTDQAFGTLANRMVHRGLIVRRTGAGRAIRHGVTPLGAQRLRDGRAVVERVLVATLGSLSPKELDTLAALLERLLAAPVPCAAP
jgi:DNA-binding MarR family transcriptional regulator